MAAAAAVCLAAALLKLHADVATDRSRLERPAGRGPQRRGVGKRSDHEVLRRRRGDHDYARRATISDPDSPTLVGLSVTITNPFDGPAEVLDATVTGTTIAKSYSNGVLTLTGVAPIADYATVLRSITFNDVAATPYAAEDRVVTFVAYDGMAYSTVATAKISDPPAPSSSTQMASSPAAGVSLQQNVSATSPATPATPSAPVAENAQEPTSAASAAVADLAQSSSAASSAATAVVQSAPVENAPEAATEPEVPSVVRNGSEVVMTGTAGDDTLQFVAGATENTVIVAGQSYSFPVGEVTAFHFNGGGGNDTAKLTAAGLASLAETAQLQPGSATLQASATRSTSRTCRTFRSTAAAKAFKRCYSIRRATICSRPEGTLLRYRATALSRRSPVSSNPGRRGCRRPEHVARAGVRLPPGENRKLGRRGLECSLPAVCHCLEQAVPGQRLTPRTASAKRWHTFGHLAP